MAPDLKAVTAAADRLRAARMSPRTKLGVGRRADAQQALDAAIRAAYDRGASVTVLALAYGTTYRETITASLDRTEKNE